MKNEFCPQGHAWQELKNMAFSDDCHYCEKCDKAYTFQPVELVTSKTGLAALRRYAKIVRLKKAITVEDLIKLGHEID